MGKLSCKFAVVSRRRPPDDVSGRDFRPSSGVVRGVLATAAVLVVAACGNGGGGTTEVQLSEFAVSPSPGSLSAGEITFDATNAGEFPHELVVARSDLAPDALPTAEDGGVDESQVTVIGRIDVFDPGTMSLALDLDEGAYVLYCNIVFVAEEGADPFSHYASGMTTGFTVSG